MKIVLEITDVYEALRKAAEDKDSNLHQFHEDNCVLVVEDTKGNIVDIADVCFECTVN